MLFMFKRELTFRFNS